MSFRLTIIIVALISCSVTSYGQYNIPVTTTMRTPYGNVPHTYYVPSPRMYYGNPNSNISAKYEFTIVLKNDSTFSTRTRINLEDEKNHSLVVKNKKVKQTYFPADTKTISRINFDGQLLTGIAADSCWLFKCGTGKINSYSFLAEVGMGFVIAIQEGNDGPIVPLTKENLEFIVGPDDPKIYQLIEKKKFIKAIEMYNKK